MYLIEMECKHCGAPLGVRSTTQQRWEKHPSKIVGNNLFNHHDHEIEFEVFYPRNVKLAMSCCSECRTLY